LQALQVKQQLGVQALSIANSEPQILLSLFGRKAAPDFAPPRPAWRDPAPGRFFSALRRVGA
jgi:hypothetical protein